MTAADRAKAAEPLTALEWLRVTHADTLSGRRIEEAVAAARADVEARWTAAVEGLAEELDSSQAEALASMRALHLAERPAMAEAYGYRANAYASAAARLRGLVTSSEEEL